jgi:hypothetical protein
MSNLVNANLTLLQVLIELTLIQWNDGNFDEPSLAKAMQDLATFMNNGE